MKEARRRTAVHNLQCTTGVKDAACCHPAMACLIERCRTLVRQPLRTATFEWACDVVLQQS